MANRRMLAKSIIFSDDFLNLSGEARLLFFHLSVEPDDDGFTASVRRTMRDAGVTESALQELIDRGYILQFTNGVILLAHWKVNNQIRSDRYTPTTYKREVSQVGIDPESQVYRWLPVGIPSTGQVSQAQQSPVQEKEKERSPEKNRGGLEGGNPCPEWKKLFTPQEYGLLQEQYDPQRLDEVICLYAKSATPGDCHFYKFEAFAKRIPGFAKPKAPQR